MGQKIAYIHVRYDICRDASLGLPCDFALLLVLTRPPLPTLRLKPFRFFFLSYLESSLWIIGGSQDRKHAVRPVWKLGLGLPPRRRRGEKGRKGEEVWASLILLLRQGGLLLLLLVHTAYMRVGTKELFPYPSAGPHERYVGRYVR